MARIIFAMAAGALFSASFMVDYQMALALGYAAAGCVCLSKLL